MKKKIKLRDLTSEQFERWMKDNCGHAKYVDCTDCPFFFSNCIVDGKKSWLNNKDLYSDKFLDIEIEVEETLLTPKEKEYLENVLRPFKDRIIDIRKREVGLYWVEINIRLKSIINEKLYDYIYLPVFEKDKYYKNLVNNKPYTKEELELFKE